VPSSVLRFQGHRDEEGPDMLSWESAGAREATTERRLKPWDLKAQGSFGGSKTQRNEAYKDTVVSKF